MGASAGAHANATVGELVEGLSATVSVLAGEVSGGVVGSELVVGLLAARERLDAVLVAAVSSWDRRRVWELDGSRSPVAWLARHAPVTRQDAATLVRTARHVEAFPATAQAPDAGEITAAHATVAARAAKHRTGLYAEHEAGILDAARTLDPAGFRQVMRYWQTCADDTLPDPDPDPDGDSEPDEVNYLDVATTFAGIGHLDGRLDPVAVKTLVDRLDALEPPDPAAGPRPPRTLAQRRAAALLRLVTGDQAPATTVDVLVDHQILAGHAPDPLHGNCELVGHGPIPPLLARTLACDCTIGRIVMRGRSEVLDVGRRTRLVTPALRRALAARDRTCVEPGCDIPAHWCDAHHRIPWQAHGPTTLDNLELRCRTHHLHTHQRWERQQRRASQRE